MIPVSNQDLLRRTGWAAEPRALWVEVVRDEARLRNLESKWERLWSADLGADVFASYDWFLNWWEHFGHGERAAALVTHDGPELTVIPGRGWQLYVCVVRDEIGEALAILPLVLVRGIFKGFHSRILASPVNNHSPRSGLIAPCFDTDVITAICDTLTSRNEWDVLLLEGFPARANRLAGLAAGMTACGLVPGLHGTWSHCYLRFPDNWGDFLASKKRHFRKRYEWAERDLRKLGELGVERFNGTEAATRGMPVFMAIDRASWKAQDGESLGAHPALERYYSGICDRLGARGRSEVWALRIGSEIAAAYLCLCDGRSRYTLKTSFSEAFNSSHHSPSNVLLGRIIRESCGTGVEGIDFVGKLPFVERWANEEDTFEYMVFYRTQLLAFQIRIRDSLLAFARRIMARVDRVRAHITMVFPGAVDRPDAAREKPHRGLGKPSASGRAEGEK